MLSIAELWTRLDALAAPLPSERIPLAGARGRVLREPILAPSDQPLFDRSAIDGYLVHADQPAGFVTLAGALHPGSPAPASAPALGSALRVLTGAALPPDAALVMQEDTRPHPGDRLELLQPPSTRHIRRRASQARSGDTLLRPGRSLDAPALALLASLGATAPLVARPARVAHLVTGSELVPPEMAPAPGQIRDCNTTLVAALLADARADLVFHRRVSDSRAYAADALDAALASSPDLLLFSGGSGPGDHDHTASLLAAAGFTLHCDKVSSRPGKPLVVASRGPLLAFGLPGNPLSHFVCFHLFVRRALARLAGSAPAPLLRATLDPRAQLRADPRETWWPCAWSGEGPARVVLPLPWRDSSDLAALASADALLRVPSSTVPTSKVEVLPCNQP